MKSCKILSCKEDIKEYLGNISDHTFRKYVRLGMPARYDGGWIAHTENLDNWFLAYTRISMRKALKMEEQNQESEIEGRS